LIVEAAGDRFAIPQLSVVELVRARANSEHRIERIQGHRGITAAQQAVAVMHLKKLLKIDDGSSAIRKTASSSSRKSAARPSASWSTVCSTPKKS